MRSLRRRTVLCALLPAVSARAEVQTFELDALGAREVFLAGEMTDWEQGQRAMARGADGRWRLALGLAPGQWVYKFVVDGRWIADPGPAGRDADGRGGEHSFVFVGRGPWEDRPLAGKGRVETTQVASPALGRSLKVHVYRPAGSVRDRPYPVLWLLHGRGMDADHWLRTGHVERYLDNLIADGRIRPMVVVMPSVPDSDAAPPYARAGERFLTQELPAWLARTHGLRTERAHAAVAGMSWGGLGAFHLATRHPQRFGLGCALSGAFLPDYLDALQHRSLPLPAATLQLRCGSEDSLVHGNRLLAGVLEARGMRFDYREDAGGHTWQYWSQRMVEMLSAADAHFGAAPR